MAKRKRKPVGYWKDPENIRRETLQMISDNDLATVPSQDWMAANGYSGLGNAVSKQYPGRIYQLKLDLGFKDVRRPPNYLKNEENVIREVDKIMAEEGLRDFPSDRVLRELGHCSIAAAICRYHGGANFRAKMGQKGIIVAHGSWKSLEFTIRRAVEVMEAHGLSDLPGYPTLRKLGHSSLSAAIIKYHGGMPNFREELREHMTGSSERDDLEGLLDEYSGGQV